ncbi:MAG: hypothetical protein KGS44_11790 [Alphaproteobacteria bacterium]|nr:hypothetical protein [Alphaproteobacteria bacterium]
MKRFWSPRTIAGRTLAVTVGLIFLAQILATLLLGAFVLRPQAQRVGGIVAQSVLAVSEAAAKVAPEDRAALIATLDRSDFLDVWQGPGPPRLGGSRPRWLEWVFMQALVDAFGPGSEIVWRTDPEQRLWLHVQIGPDMYWLSSRVPSAMQPGNVLLSSALSAIFLALLAAVVLQRRIAQPLEALTAAVEAPNGAKSLVVDDHGLHEVRVLTEAFNAQRVRLAALDEARAVMLAGVSHDIRTPLAKLRLALEISPERDTELAAAAHRQITEIDRLVGQFLLFAKGANTEPERAFDLDALVSELVALKQTDGCPVSLEGPSLGAYVGRPESLRRALANLIENASKHGKPPMRVITSQHGSQLSIAVTDAGDGAPGEALTRLATPFFRPDSGRSGGSGLGLAIAAQAAEVHGGKLRLRNLESKGFEAAILLPAQA